MYTIQERVRIVILMAKYESVTAVKRQFTKEGFQHKPTVYLSRRKVLC